MIGFIENIIKRFNTYKELGDKTLASLSDDDINYRPNEDSNSIAVIVQHMHGNMLSRFTNFLTEDGEKPWRERDEEFVFAHISKEQTIALWNEGWNAVMQVLQDLQPNDLTKTIYIRSEPLLVYDALLRQLTHYPYHVGQMVWIAKLLKGKEWQSLSIAKGESKDFNEQLTKKFKSE